MKRLVRLIVLMSVAAVVMAATASGGHVEPTQVVGNPSCAGGVKIEPVATGTYGAISIVVHDTALGRTFDFTTSGAAVTSVIVKGGPNANLYSYSVATTSDTGLHAPVNAGNGRYYGLSHLCFFSSKKPPPPPKK